MNADLSDRTGDGRQAGKRGAPGFGSEAAVTITVTHSPCNPIKMEGQAIVGERTLLPDADLLSCQREGSRCPHQQANTRASAAAAATERVTHVV